MNRGEGLRYAAHAKGTQINLFKEKEKKKPKKFNYKSRRQQFTVRKVEETDADKPPANKPQTTKTTKPSTKDFVKKNAQAPSAGGKGKERKKATAPSSGSGGGGSTVTLTQDQLNAILATIGSAAGSGAAIPNISFANGTVKVDSQNEEQNQRNQQNEKPETSETHPNRPAGGGENLSALLAKGNDSSSHAEHAAPVYDTQADRIESHKSQPENTYDDNNNNERTHSKPDVASRTSHVERKPPPSGMGFGDVSSVIGDHNQRFTLAEKKKQQWKKELDEQIAINRQQQQKQQQQQASSADTGGHRSSRGSANQSAYSPWGQPGAGAPNLSLDLSGINAEKSDGMPHLAKSSIREPTSSRITPRDVSSSLGKLATENFTPAAMRSSFIIGGDAVDSHNKMLKQKEKKQWLEELENQRRIAKEHKEQEKRKQREMDDHLTSHWAEPVTSARSKPPAQSQVKLRSTVDDFEVKKETRTHREVPLSPPRHHSADAVPTARQDSSPSGLVTHTRPSGLLVDPVEAERRETKRQKHLEHMLAVQEQVEERQRVKREAIEAKRREEAEEERKLQEEQDRLKRQFEIDKEKQRKKEEESAAKQKEMMDKVQAAYESSQREKHQKRVHRLQSHGHDTNSLTRSWEAKHSPENSPRHQPNPAQPSPRLQSNSTQNDGPVRHTPPPHYLDPISTTQHSPRQPASLYSSPRDAPISYRQDAPVSYRQHEPVRTHDMATSPVFDQAVQTDFQFPPSDVIKENNIFDLEREGSAGVEYKPNKQHRKKKEGQKKVKGQGADDTNQERTVRIQDKNKRLTKTQSEEKSEDEVTSKRTNKEKDKDKPRPIWGKTKQTKKKVGNTQKDLTGNQKKREERTRKRMEEMMALQERSAPKRLTEKKEKKKSVSVPQSRTASSLHVRENPTQDTGKNKQAYSRAVTDVDLKRGERKSSNAWTDDSKESADLPSSPPIRSGDFVPFLRHDEELDQRSLPESPPSSMSRHSQQHHHHGESNHSNKRRNGEGKTLTPKPEKSKLSAADKKDPLLNPERLKDTNLRQEKILQQLSNLRQGLMMKQRELEMGLSTSTPLIM